MTTPRARRLSPGALWASAFVLASLAVVQAGRLTGGQARADLVSQVGSYTVLTADAGTEDVLLMLDTRKEQVLVYKVENQNAIELYKRYELPRLFQDARGRTPGRK
jgi:hypothetical protein